MKRGVAQFRPEGDRLLGGASIKIFQMHFVYILLSKKNNKTYIGYTGKSVDARLKEHNIGSNKWTAANSPFKLIYYESYHCKTDAMHREKFLKSGVGNKLVRLIKNHFGE